MESNTVLCTAWKKKNNSFVFVGVWVCVGEHFTAVIRFGRMVAVTHQIPVLHGPVLVCPEKTSTAQREDKLNTHYKMIIF